MTFCETILNLFSAIGFLRYAKQRVIYTDTQYYFVYVNLRRLRLHLHNLILEFEFIYHNIGNLQLHLL